MKPPQNEPLSIHQIIENIYQNVDREYFTKVLVKRLRRIEKNMSGEAREKFQCLFLKVILADLHLIYTRILKEDFTTTMKLLRDKKFQDLLINYPRAKRQFLIGYEVQDEVSSEKLILGEKPADYLNSFMQFVKNNPEHILAIKILLEKPKDWNTSALNELREKLNYK